ncbi:hypothetical protein PybrP1_010827 [[Pythium] brassicae (nom. inval.)]|nr:hypothetical protein PybrP1_010827 [[Pythium] brassicae (nom. inval.)]
MQEPSFFFPDVQVLYQQRLVQHFHDHPVFLQPKEPLQDLSASRSEHLQQVTRALFDVYALLHESDGARLGTAPVRLYFHTSRRPLRSSPQQPGAAAAAAKKKTKAAADAPLFAGLDIRVGVITKKLYCEEIDVGEAAPKQIGSGLRAFYSLNEMQGRKVLVLLNLKPTKFGGFKSRGMVLCTADAQIGERVEPLPAAQLKKQTVWEKCALDVLTDDAGVTTYKG